MKIIERIHNVETNEITEVERDMTEYELSQYEIGKKRAEELQKQSEIAAAARIALLQKLGITEEEAKLLLG